MCAPMLCMIIKFNLYEGHIALILLISREDYLHKMFTKSAYMTDNNQDVFIITDYDSELNTRTCKITTFIAMSIDHVIDSAPIGTPCRGHVTVLFMDVYHWPE
jgi:hypothetical protein